ncbi:MAG TPA: cupin domain-containing protein [Thermomicrobiales bacterium]|nr:cupin domain-containing protein [Thermomicrobiales bacterium]
MANSQLDNQARVGEQLDMTADADSRPARLKSLGAEIRSLRQARRLSTVALARACGVSPSLISQVERGLTAPSLEVLWAIARALDVPMGAFFQPDGDARAEPTAAEPGAPAASPNAVVVRADRRKRLGLTPSLTYQLLSPDLQHRIEFVWIEYGPGEAGPIEPFTHPGEEQMVVIQGEMRIWIAGEEWLLRAGDAITFDSRLPHRAINPGATRALVIAAITPPSF